MNANGTGQTNLTPGAVTTGQANEGTSPTWSPDGTRIAFSSDRDGMPQVYVMDANGGEWRPVSDGWGEYPAWSPDGEWIAYAAYVGGTTPEGDPDYDVFVVNDDGTAATNITDDPDSYDGYPTWSPDGRLIAFTSDRHTRRGEPRGRGFELYTMARDGTGIARLTTNRLPDLFPDWQPLR